MSILKNCAEVSDCVRKDDEKLQDYLIRLNQVLCSLDDADYDKLSTESQEWNVAAVKAIKAKEACPLPPDMKEEKEDKPARVRPSLANTATKPGKVKSKSTYDCALQIVVDMKPKEGMTRAQLSAAANKLYMAQGGKDNLNQFAKFDIRRIIKAAVAYGIATFEDGKLIKG